MWQSCCRLIANWKLCVQSMNCLLSGGFHYNGFILRLLWYQTSPTWASTNKMSLFTAAQVQVDAVRHLLLDHPSEACWSLLLLLLLLHLWSIAASTINMCSRERERGGEGAPLSSNYRPVTLCGRARTGLSLIKSQLPHASLPRLHLSAGTSRVPLSLSLTEVGGSVIELPICSGIESTCDIWRSRRCFVWWRGGDKGWRHRVWAAKNHCSPLTEVKEGSQTQ